MQPISTREDFIYGFLSRLQPGATCNAWICGLVVIEAVRLTQRFDENMPVPERWFVLFSIPVAILLFALFGAAVFREFLAGFGNPKPRLDLTYTFKFHFLFTRTALDAGMLLYTYSVWQSRLMTYKIGQVNPIRIAVLLLVLLSITMNSWNTVDLFCTHHYEVLVQAVLKRRLAALSQLALETIVTMAIIYDSVFSNKSSENEKFRHTLRETFFRLVKVLPQTPLVPMIFNMVTNFVNFNRSGEKYSLLYVTAQVHLLGPIIAIVASLQCQEKSLPEDNSLHKQLPRSYTKNRDSMYQILNKIGERSEKLNDQRMEPHDRQASQISLEK
ncbi:hypothetical protein O181_061435 [Austropuccinia psidii MF-1]|uniref:Uncharacterized protein n=1 Tax=Austropuccinia psidii MF-1 TaxID=1389203 RepID=A0A9Q3EMD2_9BASI|nr:hypothetical protein [Austropuccinia psidii MF-1]